jgi:hypothetical protein
MDYDVAVTGLSSPPPSAVLTPYRPAVSVRNNGIHDALASGYLRIYSAGLLIFETEVYSGTLAPGATETADAVDYWTPPTEGSYIVQGYVSTPLDQVEPNNNLYPTTIIVTGAPVPPTPTVPLHAAQHEEGGTDEVSIDGLKGRAADPQDALAHAAQHQAGGSDALNVGSLQGTLAQDQPAQVHSNTRHNPIMSTAAELTAHAGSVAVHTAATNLANRDTTGPDAGLVSVAQMASGSAVPYHPNQALLLRGDGSPPAARTWGYPKHAALGYNQAAKTLLPGTGRQNILSLDVPLAWISDDMQFLYEFSGLIVSKVAPAATLTLSVWFGSVVIAATTVDVSLLRDIQYVCHGSVLGTPTARVQANLALTGVIVSTLAPLLLIDPGELLQNRPIGAQTIMVDAELDNAIAGESISISQGLIRALHPIP